MLTVFERRLLKSKASFYVLLENRLFMVVYALPDVCLLAEMLLVNIPNKRLPLTGEPLVVEKVFSTTSE